MRRLAPLLLTVVAGGLLAVQSEVNGRLSDQSHSWLLTALVSFTVGLCFLGVLVVSRAAGRAAFSQVLTALRSRALSWWVMAAGVLSAGYVVLQAGTVTTLGVAMFSLAVICGMNVGSILVDRFGARRGEAIAITSRRVWAVIVSLAAALLAVIPYIGQQSPPVVYFLLVIAAGVGAAIQFTMTARVGESSGDSTVAAWFLFVIAAVFLFVISLAQGALWGDAIEGMSSAVTDSPWLLVGGFLGAMVVVINAFVVPRSGVLVFSLSLIAGQLIAALVIDLSTGSVTDVGFIAGACALMILATAISAGARLPRVRVS